MKKKVILAILCPLLAVVVAAAGFGYWYSNNNMQPADSPPPTQPIEEQLESVFPVIPEEQFYARSNRQSAWAFDMTDTEMMLNESHAVVRARVLSAQKTLYVSPYHSLPNTPLKVQVLEVLSGDIKTGTQTIYFPGGAVTAEQYLEQNPSSGAKMGLLELSKNERKKMYIESLCETDFDLKKNAEYVFLLIRNDELDKYFVGDGAYSTFTTGMKNVKSQKELKSTNAGKAKGANKGNIGNGQNKPAQ